ncbi:hypothetical protein DFH11DRAFT_1291340 [Phellopilus nigrolimitatus]|nr:hypothetical protein DFH11DRAFT_1291340 [Phellopilus nigrolimitatus]
MFLAIKILASLSQSPSFQNIAPVIERSSQSTIILNGFVRLLASDSADDVGAAEEWTSGRALARRTSRTSRTCSRRLSGRQFWISCSVARSITSLLSISAVVRKGSTRCTDSGPACSRVERGLSACCALPAGHGWAEAER